MNNLIIRSVNKLPPNGEAENSFCVCPKTVRVVFRKRFDEIVLPYSMDNLRIRGFFWSFTLHLASTHVYLPSNYIVSNEFEGFKDFKSVSNGLLTLGILSLVHTPS